MTAPIHEVIAVPSGDKSLREQCHDIRIQVFVLEQGFPLEAEEDESV
jgi:hypothetical protein